MKENEILKKTLRHYIDLEYYANGVDEEFQTLLKELERVCGLAIKDKTNLNTKQQYNLIIRFIKEQVEEFKKKLLERLEKEAEVIMEEEELFLDSVYNNESSNVSDIALAIGGVTLAKLLFTPFDGRDNTKQFVERTGNNIIQAYDTSLRSGYIFGQKSEDIVKQVAPVMNKVENGMKSGIRTAIPAYAKTTDRIIFLNNNAEIVYCSTLDGNTCLVCGDYHGQHFKSITEAPSLPIHANCRCVYLKSSDVKEPLPTYQEYIESLSEEEQEHILGANRYNLWKQYNIPLKKFVNDGRKLNLNELDLPPNLAVTNSGAKSKIVEILSNDDILKNEQVVDDYYAKIRTGDNKDFITRIAQNSGKSYQDIEKIINHIFKEQHVFEGGIVKYFDASEDIVKALERLKTKEFTDTDLLLLDHELLELTYMKNKKYNIYEIAHEMANKKYNWEEVLNNANLS